MRSRALSYIKPNASSIIVHPRNSIACECHRSPSALTRLARARHIRRARSYSYSETHTHDQTRTALVFVLVLVWVSLYPFPNSYRYEYERATGALLLELLFTIAALFCRLFSAGPGAASLSSFLLSSANLHSPRRTSMSLSSVCLPRLLLSFIVWDTNNCSIALMCSYSLQQRSTSTIHYIHITNQQRGGCLRRVADSRYRLKSRRRLLYVRSRAKADRCTTSSCGRLPALKHSGHTFERERFWYQPSTKNIAIKI